ncbi:unnamed protein product [Caenorhabditis sp. 36 PRJEB53466]|nr:unnamed protein product [Caenorhabditis sp. 36 PRJEB53466]
MIRPKLIPLCLSVVLSVFIKPASSSLPTFAPDNKEICEGFGFNWAAEIRCLRDVVGKCLESESSGSERKGRSLQYRPEDNRQDAVRTADYGNPYSYPRPYSRTYYHHSISSIRPPVPPIPAPITSTSCKCDGLEKLEAKFEKKLYEVKMRAQYESEKEIKALEQRYDFDMREFQRITTKDIADVKRRLDYIQAPKVVNNDNEYFMISREEGWYTASEKCIGYGAHLASVHSRLENGLVSSLIPTNMTAWIGANDIQKESVFRNTDGSAVEFYKWGPKQPNNEEHNENCVEVGHNGLWNDKLCIITRPFVCKKKLR